MCLWTHLGAFVVETDAESNAHSIVKIVAIEKVMKDPYIVVVNSREEHYGPRVVRSRFGIVMANYNNDGETQ